MEREMMLDTLQTANYNTRIEYRLLETQRKLLKSNFDYNKWAYVPSLNLNGAYNFNYQSNEWAKIYNNNYPNSYVALTLSVPLYQGGKRKSDTREAELQLKRTDWILLI
jgi:outer membrane protein TolC